MLYDEISRIRGAILGCQQASEEARNRVMEFGAASVHTLQLMQQALPDYMEEVNKKLIGAGNA